MYILHCFNIHISTSRLLETCKSHKTASLILRILQSISITENLGNSVSLEDTEQPPQQLSKSFFFPALSQHFFPYDQKENLTVSRAFPSQSTCSVMVLSSLHVHISALFLSHRQAPIGFSACLFFGTQTFSNTLVK